MISSFLNNKRVEDQMHRRLGSIEKVVNFISFFESNKRVHDICNIYDIHSGFYK